MIVEVIIGSELSEVVLKTDDNQILLTGVGKYPAAAMDAFLLQGRNFIVAMEGMSDFLNENGEKAKADIARFFGY